MLADTIWRARCRMVRDSQGRKPQALELTEEAVADLRLGTNWWMFLKTDPNTGAVTQVYDLPLTITESNRIQAHDGQWEIL